VFGFGITELIVVGLVILMLFSPRELPGMMKTLARVYGSIRRTAEEFRAQVMEAEELREPIEEIRAAYHGTKQELLSAQELARRELGRARAEAMKAQQKLTELHREETRREAEATAALKAASNPSPAPVLQGRVSASEPLEGDAKPAASPPVPEASKPVAPPPTASSAPVPEASKGLNIPPAPKYPSPAPTSSPPAGRSDAA
jgi:Sec-independent protein translocase protein TatA